MTLTSAPVTAAFDDYANRTITAEGPQKFDGDIAATGQVSMKEPFRGTTLLRAHVPSADLLLHDVSWATPSSLKSAGVALHCSVRKTSALFYYAKNNAPRQCPKR
jgi:hypothetical protein